jgi:plasmid stabilization system protein ParE
MRTFRFHPEARRELLESVRYYERQRSGLGRGFIAAVSDAVQRILEYPLMYREIAGGCRQCRVQYFPYGIICRFRGDGGERGKRLWRLISDEKPVEVHTEKD